MEQAAKGKSPKNKEQVRVGRTLHTLRERYGYTQEAFGTALGISRSYISLIESGHKPLPDRLLSRAADLLEITPLAIKHFDHNAELVAA
jgi:transcriptional regulator with XRE-family HTH domain